METYHELIGQTVADRYEVRSLLGVGGIGAVYLAIQQPLGREVALKVLHSHLYSRPGTAARFLREARAASLLNHPGSVSIYDYGEWGDRHYIAMEFVAGRTLTSVIATEFPLETRRIAEYIMQLCDVLDVAHEMPLV
ncbi:MAG: serine/threonine protein kinase, partial [Myxococcota bacterium]